MVRGVQMLRKKKTKKHSIMALAGIVKGGAPSSEAEIDEVLYG